MANCERDKLICPAAQERDQLRAALQGLVDALAANDEDGLTEFAEPMAAARRALSKSKP